MLCDARIYSRMLRNTHLFWFLTKMSLININMTRIDLASENDIRFGFVNWAKLFMAETWEELKMLAEKDNPGT